MASPLSVLHVLAPARYGGLETVVTTLAPALLDLDVRVTVGLVLPPGDDPSSHPVACALDAAGVPVETLTTGSRRYMAERRWVRELLGREGADVLHTHGYRPDVVDAPVARVGGIATVTTVHGFTGGGWRNRSYEWLQTRAFRRFSAVVAVSPKLRRELGERGVPESRLRMIPNAWAPAARPVSRDEARRRLGLAPDRPAIGWIGRLSREKAPDVMIRSAAALGDDRTGISIVGEGPEERRCRALAEELGVGGRITWHGPLPDAGTLLAAFDAVALTSWTEGTPMVLLEASAAGVPVVATAVGGIPDVLSPSEAYLCGAGAVDELAEAMRAVLSDPEEAATRAARARRRVQDDFAVEPWARRYRALYARLVQDRGAGP